VYFIFLSDGGALKLTTFRPTLLSTGLETVRTMNVIVRYSPCYYAPPRADQSECPVSPNNYT